MRGGCFCLCVCLHTESVGSQHKDGFKVLTLLEIFPVNIYELFTHLQNKTSFLIDHYLTQKTISPTNQIIWLVGEDILVECETLEQNIWRK